MSYRIQRKQCSNIMFYAIIQKLNKRKARQLLRSLGVSHKQDFLSVKNGKVIYETGCGCGPCRASGVPAASPHVPGCMCYVTWTMRPSDVGPCRASGVPAANPHVPGCMCYVTWTMRPSGVGPCRASGVPAGCMCYVTWTIR